MRQKSVRRPTDLKCIVDRLTQHRVPVGDPKDNDQKNTTQREQEPEICTATKPDELIVPTTEMSTLDRALTNVETDSPPWNGQSDGMQVDTNLEDSITQLKLTRGGDSRHLYMTEGPVVLDKLHSQSIAVRIMLCLKLRFHILTTTYQNDWSGASSNLLTLSGEIGTLEDEAFEAAFVTCWPKSQNAASR